MARTFIFGDVHGMTDLLKALLEKLSPRPGDTVISLGDLLDKGPDPVGSVRYLRHLAETAPFTVRLVAANHEDRHLRYQRNLITRPKIARGMATMAPELAHIAKVLTPADRAFLATGELVVHLPGQNMICVHAGIPGNMVDLPPPNSELHTLTSRSRSACQQVMRVRYVEAETGRMLKKDREGPNDPFWATNYNGRFGHVVFGHQPFMDGVAHFPHATGLDTGAVHGGALTAMIVDEDGTRSFVSVPAPFAVIPPKAHHIPAI